MGGLTARIGKITQQTRNTIGSILRPSVRGHRALADSSEKVLPDRCQQPGTGQAHGGYPGAAPKLFPWR